LVILVSRRIKNTGPTITLSKKPIPIA